MDPHSKHAKPCPRQGSKYTYKPVICFLEVGRLKVLEPEWIYQNRTCCNRLSLCIAWTDGPMVSVRLDGLTSRRRTTGQAIHSDNLLQLVRF